MPADERDDVNEDFDSPHLPERYHQAVKARKQARLKRNLLISGAVIVGLVLLYILISWIVGGIYPGLPASSSSFSLPALPVGPPAAQETPAFNSTNASPSYTRGPGLAGPLPAGAVPLEQALAAVEADYPGNEFTIVTADFSPLSGRSLYVFMVRPAATGTTGTGNTVYIDAMTGTTYSQGEENAVISRGEARKKAISFFPSLHSARIILGYHETTDDGTWWEYDMYSGDRKAASGSFDAATGELRSFTRYPLVEGRPASPAIDAGHARSIAERYIIDHNGGQLPLNMSQVQYLPLPAGAGSVAGQYHLKFERTYQDFPTDVDGFEVTVDAMTGEVTGYERRWTTPDHAFATVTEPDIIRREATFAVMQRAKEQFPADVDGLRIISAEIRWKNKVPYGTVPRPGSIPLGWKVVFDDNVIRANASAQPAVAWVDVQSGDFISFEYRH